MFMKKTILIIAFFVYIISLFGQNVIKIDNIRYQIQDGYAQITRQDPDLSGDIVIPDKIEYNGKEYVVSSMSYPSNTASYGGMSSISAEGATFQGCKITSITLPATITEISSAAFINCTELVSVTLPETLTSIGWGSFAYCSKLETINIPNAVTNISTWAFGGCYNLKSLTLPSGITSLPNAVFKNCGFEEFTIPENIVSMGEACLNMSSLKSVKSYIRDITRVGYRETCFGNVSNVDLFVPIGSKSIYIEYYPWRGFKSITEFDEQFDIVYYVDLDEYKRVSVNYGSTITPEPAPTKEGYTFSGWSEIPETMPAHDVTVTGTFNINKYKLTYIVDGEEYRSYELEYGTTITPETAPTKEGYTFSGWSEIPETMPANDVTVTGTFTKNSYTLTYILDGENYKTYTCDFNAVITPEAPPEREGYTFSGWSKIPETMPANDVTVIGTFTINKYKLSYLLNGEIYKESEIEFGSSIIPEDELIKEGFSFSGWSKIPETMPANDLIIIGTLTINKYRLTYLIDGQTYKEYEVEYGSPITPEGMYVWEGYTFSGWDNLPETMPANDVIVTGSITLNKYKLTYLLDGQTYKEYEIEFGASITPEAEPAKEGFLFSGWSDIPESMPAHDVEITGTLKQVEFVIDDMLYEIIGEGTVAIKGGNQEGEVVINAIAIINSQAYQVTAIAENAFKDNRAITSLTIADGITTIGDNAFNGCVNLIVINIGKNVQTIGSKAFANVGSASARTRGDEVSLVVNCYAENVPQTASDAFENTPIESGKLLVDDNLVGAFKSTLPWSQFGKIFGFNDPTGISSVKPDSGNAFIFDMQGIRLDNVRKGVNIIRTKDGKTKKVVVR